MPGLWPTQRVFEEVRHLSDLLSYVCIPGQTARSSKIKLVSRLLDAGSLTLVVGWPPADGL